MLEEEYMYTDDNYQSNPNLVNNKNDDKIIENNNNEKTENQNFNKESELMEVDEEAMEVNNYNHKELPPQENQKLKYSNEEVQQEPKRVSFENEVC